MQLEFVIKHFFIGLSGTKTTQDEVQVRDREGNGLPKIGYLIEKKQVYSTCIFYLRGKHDKQ